MESKTKTPRVRFFASYDGALENGSFWRVSYYPAYMRGVGLYINGDYMDWGESAAATLAECDAHCEALLGTGYREYAPDEFKRLAPKCNGGNGRY